MTERGEGFERDAKRTTVKGSGSPPKTIHVWSCQGDVEDNVGSSIGSYGAMGRGSSKVDDRWINDRGEESEWVGFSSFALSRPKSRGHNRHSVRPFSAVIFEVI